MPPHVFVVFFCLSSDFGVHCFSSFTIFFSSIDDNVPKRQRWHLSSSDGEERWCDINQKQKKESKNWIETDLITFTERNETKRKNKVNLMLLCLRVIDMHGNECPSEWMYCYTVDGNGGGMVMMMKRLEVPLFYCFLLLLFTLSFGNCFGRMNARIKETDRKPRRKIKKEKNKHNKIIN